MRLVKRYWPVLAAAVAALLLGFIGIQGTGSSPYDEHTHLDYVVKVAQGQLPPVYDALGQEALSTWACDPHPAWAGLTCGAPTQIVGNGPFGGESYATDYLPVYYLPTAILAKAARAIDSGLSWWSAARLGGLVWFMAFGALTALLCSQLGARPVSSFGIALLAMSLPGTVLAFTHVTNDAAALSLVLLPPVLWLALRHKTIAVRVPIVGAAAVMTLGAKPTALAGFLSVVALEAILARGSRRQRRQTAIALAASVSGAYLIWLAVLDPVIRGVAGQAENMWAFVASLRQTWPDFFGLLWVQSVSSLGAPISPLDAPLLTATAVVFAAWGIGAGLNTTLLWSTQEDTPERVILLASFAALVLFPVLLAMALLLQGHPPFVGARYLAPSVLLAGIVAACVVRGSGAWAVAGSGAVVFVGSVAILL